MTEEEIKLAREKYSKLSRRKEELNNMKKRLLELEENPVVKEYLDLSNFINENEKSYKDLNMIWDSFYQLSTRTKNSNNIFVYMGAYEYRLTSNDKLVNISQADYVLYKDIETGDVFKVIPYKSKEFEKTHTVIHLPIEKDKELCYKDEFIRLRRDFFRDLLEKPQDEVVNKLIKEKKLGK